MRKHMQHYVDTIEQVPLSLNEVTFVSSQILCAKVYACIENDLRVHAHAVSRDVPLQSEQLDTVELRHAKELLTLPPQLLSNNTIVHIKRERATEDNLYLFFSGYVERRLDETLYSYSTLKSSDVDIYERMHILAG